MKKKLAWAGLGLGVAVVAVLALVFWPQSVYSGYYSAINENLAPLQENEFVRDVFFAPDGTGRLITCQADGTAFDVLSFSSYRLRGNTLVLQGVISQRSPERPYLSSDGTLSLHFVKKDGGFVLENCHYERIEA